MTLACILLAGEMEFSLFFLLLGTSPDTPDVFLWLAEGSSGSVWEGVRTSFFFIHLLKTTRSPRMRPVWVSQVKNKSKLTRGVTDAFQQLWVTQVQGWVSVAVGHARGWRSPWCCLQSCRKQPWVRSGLAWGKNQQVTAPLGLVPSARDALSWP